jgi:hypothetical protein
MESWISNLFQWIVSAAMQKTTGRLESQTTPRPDFPHNARFATTTTAAGKMRIFCTTFLSSRDSTFQPIAQAVISKVSFQEFRQIVFPATLQILARRKILITSNWDFPQTV